MKLEMGDLLLWKFGKDITRDIVLGCSKNMITICRYGHKLEFLEMNLDVIDSFSIELDGTIIGEVSYEISLYRNGIKIPWKIEETS